MAATPDGSIWMAETGYLWSNLYRYAGGTPEAVQIGDYHTNPPSPLGPVGVFEIEVAPDGDLWVGGFVGDAWDEVVLTRYDGAEWTTYDWPFPDHSEEGQVLFFDLSVGPDGTLWVAFPGGLGSYDGANWSVRAATDTTGAVAGAVDVAPDGTVWYTDGDGLHTLTP